MQEWLVPPLFLFASLIISYLILKTMTCQDSHHKYNSSEKLIVILYKVMLVCTTYLLICASHYSYAPFFNCIQALLVLIMVWVNKKWTLNPKNKSSSEHGDNPTPTLINYMTIHGGAKPTLEIWSYIGRYWFL